MSNYWVTYVCSGILEPIPLGYEATILFLEFVQIDDLIRVTLNILKSLFFFLKILFTYWKSRLREKEEWREIGRKSDVSAGSHSKWQ